MSRNANILNAISLSYYEKQIHYEFQGYLQHTLKNSEHDVTHHLLHMLHMTTVAGSWMPQYLQA